MHRPAEPQPMLLQAAFPRGTHAYTHRRAHTGACACGYVTMCMHRALNEGGNTLIPGQEHRGHTAIGGAERGPYRAAYFDLKGDGVSRYKALLGRRRKDGDGREAVQASANENTSARRMHTQPTVICTKRSMPGFRGFAQQDGAPSYQRQRQCAAPKNHRARELGYVTVGPHPGAPCGGGVGGDRELY